MTDIHCAGCPGTDYLGRSCRGHHCYTEQVRALASELAEAMRAFLSRPTSPSLMADMEHALAAYDKDHER